MCEFFWGGEDPSSVDRCSFAFFKRESVIGDGSADAGLFVDEGAGTNLYLMNDHVISR